MMEKIIKKVADITAQKLGYDDEKAAVISYGLLAITQMLTLLILSLLVGLIFGCLIECFIIYLFAGVLRKFTGGVHSKTLLGCTVIAIFIIGLLGIFSKYALIDIFNKLVNTNLYYLVYVTAAIFFLPCIIMVYKIAPVESVNKPIRKPEKRKRLKKQSIIAVVIYFLLAILLLFLARNSSVYFTAAVALLFSTIWQCFTLTKLGHKFIGLIDFIKPTTL